MAADKTPTWWLAFEQGPEVTANELLVLLYLLRRGDFADGRNSHPSVPTIGKACRLSERSVQRALRLLTARGTIAVQVAAGGGRRSTVYAVDTDRLRRVVPFSRARGDSQSPLTGDSQSPRGDSQSPEGCQAVTRPIPRPVPRPLRAGARDRYASSERKEPTRDGLLVMRSCSVCGAVQEGRIEGSQPVYEPCPCGSVDWFAECRERHQGSCGLNRRQHAHRMAMDASSRTRA